MAKGNIRRSAARYAGRTPNLSVAVVSGAGVSTNIAVTGITRRDQLVSVLEVPAATTTLVDRTATTSITSDGSIQCTADTTGNQLLVLFYSL